MEVSPRRILSIHVLVQGNHFCAIYFGLVVSFPGTYVFSKHKVRSIRVSLVGP